MRQSFGFITGSKFSHGLEELFGVRLGDLIQAVSFEEMQPLVLDQEPTESSLISETSDLPAADDGEGQDASETAA